MRNQAILRDPALCWIYSVLLSISMCVTAQQPPLEKVRAEAAKLRNQPLQPPPGRNHSVPLHAALRDWVESSLPQSSAPTRTDIPKLRESLIGTLNRSGLFEAEAWKQEFQQGFVTRIDLLGFSDAVDMLAVVVGIRLPCGSSDAIYLFDYSKGQRRRVLESLGSRDHDEQIIDVMVSRPDPSGYRLLMTLRDAVQCGSSWNVLAYDLFRTSSATALPVLSGEHGIWFGPHPAYQVRLEPDDLLLEIRDRSIDLGIHSRAHVLHFKPAANSSTMERVDPAALQPQDFVDEWLTREWSEMESRTAAGSRQKLKEWRDTLTADFAFGEFRFVQPCHAKAGRWQIAVDLDRVDKSEKSRTVYFLVEELGQYRYRMNAISFDRQPGCPGEQPPSFEIPTLFPNNSK